VIKHFNRREDEMDELDAVVKRILKLYERWDIHESTDDEDYDIDAAVRRLLRLYERVEADEGTLGPLGAAATAATIAAGGASGGTVADTSDTASSKPPTTADGASSNVRYNNPIGIEKPNIKPNLGVKGTPAEVVDTAEPPKTKPEKTPSRGFIYDFMHGGGKGPKYK
jgi:hypothetical protein